MAPVEKCRKFGPAATENGPKSTQTRARSPKPIFQMLKSYFVPFYIVVLGTRARSLARSLAREFMSLQQKCWHTTAAADESERGEEAATRTKVPRAGREFFSSLRACRPLARVRAANPRHPSPSLCLIVRHSRGSHKFNSSCARQFSRAGAISLRLALTAELPLSRARARALANSILAAANRVPDHVLHDQAPLCSSSSSRFVSDHHRARRMPSGARDPDLKRFVCVRVWRRISSGQAEDDDVGARDTRTRDP